MLLKTYGQDLRPQQTRHIVECLRQKGLIVYPTDTVYAVGTALSNIQSLDRLAQIKLHGKKDLSYTLLCRDISDLSRYTPPLSNTLFRFMKGHVPGPFTFVLNANHEVPRLFQGKKKTIGIRIPDHPVVQQILEAFGEPLLSTSLDAPEDEPEYLTDPELIHERYNKHVDLVIDGGIGKIQYSTVLDCTGEEIALIRQGIGIL
ncbi:MAG: threonylcarbamoyl-AMP synthase [Bacteroidales bacterium]|nr:threonylcarbamoyl-AMP synthase [Bacteroidales bacterium]